MCFLNLLGYSAVNWHSPRLVSVLAIVSFTKVVGYVVLWFYWEGRNWARRLVLVTSAISFWLLRWMDNASALARMTIILDVVTAAFLLYWLNTVAAKSYFSRPDAATQL